MEDKVREFLNSSFPGAVIREDNFRAQQSFYIRPEMVVPICEELLSNDALDLKYLSDITSLDWLGLQPEKAGRFEVVYNLYSLTHKYRFFLKVCLPGDNPTVASVSHLWPAAEWLEREVFDMMGIIFDGHPDLSKILTPDELEGHPLRKDFPLTWEQPQFSWNKDQPPEVVK
ncbi:MAG TPA: NADH-quinone oxidoreductase subunit C [Candidatus Deferrimicrobium sp.]|nr:NADH-quinone oxidoreductase subunit C [Candidatus Deferrimicrobium sp.]